MVEGPFRELEGADGVWLLTTDTCVSHNFVSNAIKTTEKSSKFIILQYRVIDIIIAKKMW